MWEFESTEAENACARRNQTPTIIKLHSAVQRIPIKQSDMKSVFLEWERIKFNRMVNSNCFFFHIYLSCWAPTKSSDTFYGIVAKAKMCNLSYVFMIAETKTNHRSWWNRMTFRRKMFEPIAFWIGSLENRINHFRAKEIAETDSSKHVSVKSVQCKAEILNFREIIASYLRNRDF